jgi:hypothetical protein
VINPQASGLMNRESLSSEKIIGHAGMNLIESEPSAIPAFAACGRHDGSVI